jgi:hypothetical protein
MIRAGNERKNHLRLSVFACPGHGRPPVPGNWQAFYVNHQLLTVGCNPRRILFSRNDAGMSLKTKDRCRKLGAEAGMCLKKRHLALQGGDVVENTGG